MNDSKTEVLIAGAGPVGLFTAILLAEAGIRVEIIDRESRVTARSYACALHPRSLRALDQLGIAPALLERGRRISTMAFYDGETRQAEIDFSKANKEFPFLLVLPQNVLEAELEKHLQEKARISVRWNYRLDAFEPVEHGVLAQVEKLGGTAVGYIVPHWEQVVVNRRPIQASFLVGADGHNSLVRHRLNIEYERVAGPELFAAVEFISEQAMEDEVRVVLNAATTNVLWPLPDKKYCWKFQLTHSELPAEFPEKARRAVRHVSKGMDEDLRHWVETVTHRRAPWFSASIEEIVWCTQVAFEHRLAKQFGRGRCWLAGDAAHQTGPVGAQSMNMGFYDAASLAARLKKILRDEGPLDLLDEYNRERQDEWNHLLGTSGGLKPKSETGAWTRGNCGRLLSCLPASGEDLSALAKQLDLEFA